MSPKVAILGGGSLFTDGIISRLRNSYPSTFYEVIDLNGPDPLVKMISLALDIVVMIQPDAECALKLQRELYSMFPHLKMIIIEPQSDRARLIQWDEFQANKVGDISNMISNLAKDDQNSALENPR